MRNLLVLIISLFFTFSVKAQLCLGDNTTICPGQSVTISALCASSGNPVFILDSMQQVSLTDDQYSGAVNIGFPFTYYGVNYNQVVIASNNYITFDVSQAGGYSPWSIGNAAPSAALPLNVVMGPYQDINPGLGGTIEYGTLGTAPNRIFVVRYNQVPMFSCTNDIFCSSLFLFEGTNHIELHIDNKPLCPTWNAGVAIEGIQNQTGTLASIVTGRNFPTQWTAFADAVSLTPTGPSSYSISTIPYVPSLLASGIQWWDTDGNFLGTGFDITVTPTNDTTGYYIVYDQCYTGSGGTTNDDTAWVYHSPLPQIVTTTTDANCITPTGTATAIASGYSPFTYQWNDPMAQNTPTAVNLAPGNYMITVTDSNGCSNQVPVLIDSIGYTYNGGSIMTRCNGDSTGIAFAGTTPFDTTVSYLWDANAFNQTTDTATGLPAGNYTVYITDTLGCMDSVRVTVAEPQAMTITDTIVHPSCNGSGDGSISITVNGGTPGYNYSWGSNQLSGLTQGSYTVTVTDTNNCMVVDSFLLTQPNPITTIMDTISATCGLSDGTVMVTAQGGTPGYTYVWNPGGPGGDNLGGVPTGNYSVIVTDQNGCTDTNAIFLNEVPRFSVGFTLSPNQGITPLEVFFTNTSTNCVSYYWDFGNGDTSTTWNPSSITYTAEGTYTVTLIGCNAGGCCDTVTQTVIVENTSICRFANVFSPNGDGMNDFFDVDCDKIIDYNIVIFNRWGNKVFESSDINSPWDGTNGGSDVPEGTYFYIIKAIGIDDVDWSEKGSFSLVR